MKFNVVKLILISLLAFFNSENLKAQSTLQTKWAKAFEMNQRLGRGMNIGNTFDALPSRQSKFDPDDLRKIAQLGFTHVRLPIRWEREDRSLEISPYTIDPVFFKTIQLVVDSALKNHLHIIINMHHHDDLMADPIGQKSRFLSQWKQIAEYFKNYPDSLLFEILNEPHDKITPELWNEFSGEAIQVIRYSNPKRCILLSGANWSGVKLESLNIPDDKYLILTAHYYNPLQFTHQGAEWTAGSDAWIGTTWNDTPAERLKIIEDFQRIIQISKDRNIPIHIGEFGTNRKADMPSRVRWTRFLARWFEQEGFSWAYWEWNTKFGVYDPQNKSYRTDLLNALIKDKMPSVQKDSIH